MTKRSTTGEFINKAKEVHGETYDYSLVEYVTVGTKVKIICKHHGIFEQTPNNHMRGQGCGRCGKILNGANRAKIYADMFIDRANAIHKHKYKYELVKYVNGVTKVEIICKIHGIFKQSPDHHLSGRGCRKCAIESTITSIRDFKEKSEALHNNKYDYSKVKFSNGHDKVTIICPEHGPFLQAVHSHMRGFGCRKCQVHSYRLPLIEFIHRSNIKHSNRYDYTNIIPDIDKVPRMVDIVCPMHGVFTQNFADHLKGNGCRKCGREISSKKLVEFSPHRLLPSCSVYLLEFSNENTKFIKIGITSKSLKHRFRDKVYKQFKVENLYVIENLPSQTGLYLEQTLLGKYKEYSYFIGNDIKFSGKTELLQYNTELINNIKKDLENYEQLINTTDLLQAL